MNNMRISKLNIYILISFSLFGIISGNYSIAQVSFVLKNIPSSTPAGSDIYISGSFDNWSGGNAAYKLNFNNGKYSITFPQQTGTIQFKFTRGSWSNVEKGAAGEEITNRTYTFGGNGDTVFVNILNWADGTSGSTAASNVYVMSNAFEMPQFPGRKRKIWIYMPPDYDKNTEHYPVLYMHDGQNLFDKNTAFSGEWKVDETMNKLSDEKKLNLIVVGIENGGNYRIDEYTPWKNASYGGGDAEKYIDFIVQSLKPYVDSVYRTMPEQDHTGILGSSLGGLVSHYAALAFPDVFGKIGVFSPSFWFSDTCYTFAKEHANIQNQKMYFMAGDAEGAGVVSNIDKMIKTMSDVKYDTSKIFRKIVPGGMHNEALWSSQFEAAVKWLFLDTNNSTNAISNFKLRIFPNPTKNICKISTEQDLNFQLELLDSLSTIVLKKDFKSETNIDLTSLPKGTYIVKCTSGNQYFIDKLIKQ